MICFDIERKKEVIIDSTFTPLYLTQIKKATNYSKFGLISKINGYNTHKIQDINNITLQTKFRITVKIYRYNPR